ncbi:MAG TPA: hypothetical protein VJY62_20895 [Bacteroidia bacterium]|nr:hypothetical protein [Bacteroidia bacterium]
MKPKIDNKQNNENLDEILSHFKKEKTGWLSVFVLAAISSLTIIVLTFIL